MTPWEEYKKKRALELQNGASVKPTDMLNRANYTDAVSANARLEICEACPSLLKLTHQCKECGCFMKLKVKLAEATCPLGKW